MKAVIVAAGLGTRLLPITKVIPKEMLPILDKPVLHYIVEEAVNSGINEIYIVINKNKELIRKYFTLGSETNEKLDELRLLLKKVNMHFAYQEKQLGLGDAVNQVKLKEPFALLLGDSIMACSVPCIKQLIDAFNETKKTVINVERVPQEFISRFGIVEGIEIKKNVYKVSKLTEKPRHSPSNLAICGRYILTPKIFACLAMVGRGHNNEIQLTDALSLLLGSEGIYAYLFDGKRYDIGNKDSYLEVIRAFST